VRRAALDRVPDEAAWALQLSGGVDSSAVQAVVRSDRCYTVTFPKDGVDNLSDARTAGQGVEPLAVTFGLADLESALPRVAYHLDTPATWTAVCQWFLAERMAADGIRVVLTGEGADELFGGYARYRVLWHLDRMASDPILSAYAPLVGHVVGDRAGVLARVLARGGDLERAREVVRRFDPGGSLVGAMARIDWHTTMQVLLRMADRMNAAFSLENRAPFLDHRLIEFAARVPERLKLDGGWTKAVLRSAAESLGVPPSVARAPTKRGLFLPWGKWSPPTGGTRGAWDRASFAARMRAAWRGSFFGE
jgi:asparagine synthase (glutamine-hydrolysing)